MQGGEEWGDHRSPTPYACVNQNCPSPAPHCARLRGMVDGDDMRSRSGMSVGGVDVGNVARESGGTWAAAVACRGGHAARVVRPPRNAWVYQAGGPCMEARRLSKGDGDCVNRRVEVVSPASTSPPCLDACWCQAKITHSIWPLGDDGWPLLETCSTVARRCRWGLGGWRMWVRWWKWRWRWRWRCTSGFRSGTCTPLVCIDMRKIPRV